MRLSWKRTWLLHINKWVIYAVFTLIITLCTALLGFITYVGDTSQDNDRRVFESSGWNALQLQIQSYRFINYFSSLDPNSSVQHDDVSFEYDLLMSRIDLLRKGEIGDLLRKFNDPRIIKLLNIINGELELVSFNIYKIEAGDNSYIPKLLQRMQRIKPNISELVSLINKDNTKYINDKHIESHTNLTIIKVLASTLAISLILACVFAMKALSELRAAFVINKKLQSSIQVIHENKTNTMTYIHQEMRHPINAILAAAQTFRKNETSTTTPFSKISKHIEQSGHQLLNTINMFSDLSLINIQQLSLTPYVAHLQERVETYVGALEQQIARKELQCTVYIDPALPYYISIDFKRVKSIIIGLLQNAISHTLSGNISLQIRPSTLSPPLLKGITDEGSQEQGTEMQMLQIAVKDTGLGIPSQLQESLRKMPFLRRKEDEPILENIGLNLALCFKLVELMKGEIQFTSLTDKGTEFWVDIPYHVPDISPEATPTIMLPKKRALFIEEDSHLSEMVAQQLLAFNIDTVISTECIGHKNQQYDLVLLGNTSCYEGDIFNAVNQWRHQAIPMMSYQPKVSKEIDASITPLTFPLCQSQLKKVLSRLFIVVEK
ncbi:HAMP domain-containing histidine kinase [Marinomonas sp.]|nr:HAMP domain-containing sensor histidine kinase [Marinomonas sp.]MDB4836836.1 HAMP domain-containing histidine kinase [Marinomonas sp.]